MSAIEIGQLIALLGVLAVALPPFVAWLQNRKRVSAQNMSDMGSGVDDISSAAERMVKRYEGENEILRKKVQDLETRVSQLEKELIIMRAIDIEHVSGIQLLCHQLISMNQQPLYKIKSIT